MENDTINDGGPAFPTVMSLRDWFAGAALQGLLVQRQEKSDYGMDDDDGGGIVYKGGFVSSHNQGSDAYDAARDAYEFADAMLESRARKDAAHE